MNHQDDDKKNRDELEELNKQYRSAWGISEQRRKEEEILKSIVGWGKRNPDDLEYLFKRAQGKGTDSRFGIASENPLFYLALGEIGNPIAVPWLEKALKSYSKKILSLCIDEMLQALIQIEDDSSFEAISRLLKKPKKTRLTARFLSVIDDVPNPRFLPIIMKIAESGITYRISLILVRMSENYDVPFLEYLNSKNKYVRTVAVEALRISRKEMDSNILLSLESLVAKRNEDILTRSTAAEILQENGVEVPLRFRKRKHQNVSDNIARFVEGLLFPERRNDTWALEEIVNLQYEKDLVRVSLRYSILPFAEIKIWRGCFWDVFKMGFSFSKPFFSGGKYKVIGMVRATNFESKLLEVDYLISNLDRVLVSIVNGIVKSRGESYMATMETINQAIRTGNMLLFKGQQTWEVDKEKIQEQGGC